MELDLLTSDAARVLARVSIEPQATRPPLIMWQNRHFVRGFDQRYRETAPVFAREEPDEPIEPAFRAGVLNGVAV
jgi:hypothetical protein